MATASSVCTVRHSSYKSFLVHLPEFGRTHELVVDGQNTVAELRGAAAELMERYHGSGVKSRMMGLPSAQDDLSLSELKLKAPHSVIVISSPAHVTRSDVDRAEQLRSQLPVEHHYVLRNLDEEPVPITDPDALRRRIQLRVEKYVGYMQLAELDPSKKNLVLDIDYTILDTDVFNNTSLTPSHWRRPNLHELLEIVYPYYNIIIWSATGNAHVQHKLQQCGVLDSPRFKIALLIDYGAMVRVCVERGGIVREFNTKPLNVLWGIWNTMNEDNTLIVDDHRRSFIANSENGIHISSFRSKSRNHDREFKHLATYLLDIRHLDSLRMVHHDYWREVATDQVPLSAVCKRFVPAMIDTAPKTRRKPSSGSIGEGLVEDGYMSAADLEHQSPLTSHTPARRTRSAPRGAGSNTREISLAVGEMESTAYTALLSRHDTAL